jgi:hypothetical protein
MFVIDDKDNILTNNLLKLSKTLESVKEITESKSFIKIDQVDYEKLMNSEPPLLSKDAEVINYYAIHSKKLNKKISGKMDEEKNKEDEIMKLFEEMST